MLEIAANYQADFARLGLDSLEAVAALFLGGAAPVETTVLVRPASLPLADGQTIAVFYKQYEYRTPSWAFVGRASKARCEFRNYAVFARLGIPCAEALACGEQRDRLGRLCRAFILTRAVAGATPLISFWQQHCADRRSPQGAALRSSLCRQLAGMTRRIHEAGFFHHDLVWRNILVAWQPPAEPVVTWIDCPRGVVDRWSPWRRRRRLKDLASLDKSASRFCTAAERLRFLKWYLGAPRLDGAAKQLARDALAYRRARWPEDWTGM